MFILCNPKVITFLNDCFHQLFLNTLCNLQNSIILCEIGEMQKYHRKENNINEKKIIFAGMKYFLSLHI